MRSLLAIVAIQQVVEAKPLLGEDILQNPDEKLAFAFELVRHGARAPIEDRALDQFPVGKGYLTPEGMRQRYLLGRYTR